MAKSESASFPRAVGQSIAHIDCHYRPLRQARTHKAPRCRLPGRQGCNTMSRSARGSEVRNYSWQDQRLVAG